MDSIVEVKLFQKPGGGGFVKVQLRSDVRPGLISFKDIDFNEASSEAGFARLVEIAGGALAEYQCEKYGDAHDPSACAKVAKEVFLELMAEISRGAH